MHRYMCAHLCACESAFACACACVFVIVHVHAISMSAFVCICTCVLIHHIKTQRHLKGKTKGKGCSSGSLQNGGLLGVL